jgi:large subunit ribosomal protein L25
MSQVMQNSMQPSEELILSQRSDFGKRNAKKIRKNGGVPCIITSSSYGAISVLIEAGVVSKLVENNNFLAMTFDSKVKTASGEQIIKIIPSKVDFHPVNGHVLHIDFLHITQDSLMVQVPVLIVGADKSAGLKRGGKLNLVRYHLPLICSLGSVPRQIEVNVSSFGIGRSVFLSSIALPNGVKMAYDCLVLSVTGRGKKEKGEDEAAAASAASAAAAKAPAAKTAVK